jgi:hypothetical protein
MALPTSGPISLNEIHIEAGGTSGTTASINDADIRALIGKAAGVTMSFSEWYGASAAVTINLTIGANTNNYNIQNSRGGTYVAGVTTVNLTINSGVVVGSTSTGTYALETGSSWASGDVINIINNGTIKGRGGDGGAGGSAVYNSSATDGTVGGVGGNAFRAQFACAFTNNGSVYGGGGGGGGTGGTYYTTSAKSGLEEGVNGGSGGGGGAGVNGGAGGAAGTASGGTVNNQGVAGSAGTATAGGSGGVTPGSSIGTTPLTGGSGGGLGSNGNQAFGQGIVGNPPQDFGDNAVGGLAGFYQVGSSLINSGSGIGGTVGGRSS